MEPGLLHTDTPFLLDSRKPIAPDSRWFDLGMTRPQLPWDLYWHPFRAYVLHRIFRAFGDFRVSDLQFIYTVEGFHRVVDWYAELTLNRVSDSEFLDKVHFWNQIVEFATLLEPIYGPRIARAVVYRDGITRTDFRDQVEAIKVHVAKLACQLGRAFFDDLHRQLCEEAKLADENSEVLSLMRLGSRRFRSQLRGSLGYAVMIRSMAELVRRFAEVEFEVQLPEEDERGPAPGMTARMKKRYFKSTRLFDGDRTQKREFLRYLELDSNTRVRCYVEGATELGAMETALRTAPGATDIDVIDLKARVVEKKEMAFSESLKRDQFEGVVSIVLIDGLPSVNAEIARTATANGDMFGGIFLASPCFEFANFLDWELALVWIRTMKRTGFSVPATAFLNGNWQETGQIYQLFKSLANESPEFAGFRKGWEWGSALMEYALKNRAMPDGALRPVISAAQHALRVRESTYGYWTDAYELNPNTGKLDRVRKGGA